MELSLSPNFWKYKIFKNAKERDLKIAEYLDETAKEADNLARVWETVINSVKSEGAADVDNNISWLRLIERPEWTIYSSEIPKSKLERFSERLQALFVRNQRSACDFIICRIGTILQKRKLTLDIIEDDLKRMKEAKFLSKQSRTSDEISIKDSVQILNNEAAAINKFASDFRESLATPKMPAQNKLFSNFYKMIFLRKISEEHLLKEFRQRYISASGLDVPMEFLRSRKVYAAFNIKNRMCGGFVLGNINPYRTIEVFAGDASKPELYQFIEGTSYCELNCFWLSVKSRKGFWGYWFWLLFAFKVSMQKEKMLIYGTIAKSLADIYGYPRKSKLLHSEQMMFNSKMRHSWIFIGARTDFFVGVLETFIYKFKNNGKRPVRYKRVSVAGVN